MSDTPRTMSVREFVRGGYRGTDGPVIVVSGDSVAGVWYPGTEAIVVKAEVVPMTTNSPVVRPFRPAPKPSQQRKAR